MVQNIGYTDTVTAGPLVEEIVCFTCHCVSLAQNILLCDNYGHLEARCLQKSEVGNSLRIRDASWDQRSQCQHQIRL